MIGRMRGNMRGKKFVAWAIGAAMLVSLCGCGKKPGEIGGKEGLGAKPGEGLTEVTTEKVTEEKTTADTEEVTTEEATEEVTTEEIVNNQVANMPIACKGLEYRIIESLSDPSINYGVMGVYGFAILNDGYDTLQNALQDNMSERIATSDYWVQNIRDFESNGYIDDNDSTLPWQYVDSVEVTRQDDTVFSFVSTVTSYLGGAHPDSFSSTYNYDVKTGKKLELAHVAAHEGITYDTIIEELNKHPNKDGFFDGWETTVQGEIYGAAEYDDLKWVLTGDGMRIIFNTYELGSYALGEVVINIKYDEHPDFFRKTYNNSNPAVFNKVTEYNQQIGRYQYEADFDGDGDGDVLQIEYISSPNEYDEYMYEAPKIYLGEDENSLSLCEDGIVSFSIVNTYVAKAKNGKSYLYVEVGGYEDMYEVMVYDISNPARGAVYSGLNMTGEFGEITPYDSEHVYVQGRSYTCGTYNTYKECYISDDGQLVAYSDLEYVINFNNEALYDKSQGTPAKAPAGARTTLYANYDFEAVSVDPANVYGGKKTTVKSGTGLMPYAVLENEFIVFLSSDGYFIRLDYDDQDGGYVRTINGVDENEILSGIQYAS